MHESIQYDPVAIHKLAKRLYRRSVFVLVFYPVIGVLVLALNGYNSGYKHGAVIGAAAGALLGYLFGTLRSMRLKVHAQTVLCLERIEANTRAK